MGLLTAEWYPCQRGPKGSYKIRGLTGLEWFELQEQIAARDGENWIDLATAGRGQLKAAELRFMLEHGVLDWRELDANAIAGNVEDKFEPGRVAEMCVEHTVEISEQILARSMVGEAREKNSLSQPKSPGTDEISTAQIANGGDIART